MLNQNVSFFPGCEQVGQLNLRLHQLAENNTKLVLDQRLRLPALLVIADEGADLDNNVMSIVHQLQQDKLIQFACAEPMIVYEPKHSEADINQLLDQMDNCSGYHNGYTGVVIVQLGKDLRASDNVVQYLMRLVADQQGKAMFILTALKSMPAQQLNNIARQLSAMVPLEMLQLTAAKPDHLADYFEQLLYDQGFGLSRDARMALPECIAQWMRQNTACATLPGMVAMRDKVVFNAVASRPMVRQQIQLADLHLTTFTQLPDARREHRTIGF